MKKYVGLLLMGLMGASPAIADTVKVGYMTTLSGGAGIIGKQMQNAVNIAMEHTGGKLGGMEAEVVFVDDQRSQMWPSSWPIGSSRVTRLMLLPVLSGPI